MDNVCYCGVHRRGCDVLRPGDVHVPNGSLFQYIFDPEGNPMNKEARDVHETLKLEGRIPANERQNYRKIRVDGRV